MAQELEIRLFGGVQVALDGAPLGPFMSAKVSALLAYLAVTGRPHRREALAGLLWGELPDAAAANNLRQALTSLRKELDPFLRITRETVELDPAQPYRLDVAELAALLAPAADLPPAERMRRLQAAADLYRGDFLAGFYVRDAPDFEEWMLAQRARYRELALNALHALAQRRLDDGEYDAAIHDAAALLALEPWREEAHGQLMLALARTGQRSAALAQYQRCRRLLWEELGVEPAAETTALYERIKAALAGPRHNLPAAAADFVGRAEEVAALQRLLAPGAGTRLVTIVGPGGVGKTRLALEAARRAEPAFLHGVWLAQLAGLADASGLPWALAQALNCSLRPEAPPEAQLLDFLRGRELLLVLDNFEHLSAPAGRRLIHRILQEAPDVKLLVASRERLGLMAERLLPLAGLDYPADLSEAFAALPAVELFVRRRRRLQPAFALGPEDAAAVLALCQMTAGLPLTLELAAAAGQALTPVEMVSELKADLAALASDAADLPERHRSLTALFEHSWRLLAGGQQEALAALSVLRDGFDQAAAQAVAGADRAMLQALTDRSLLQAGVAGRFDMHPLVQQFAAAKLAADPTRAALARAGHARYFADLAARHEAEFHGAHDRQALRRLAADAANVRVAWEWAVAQADPALLEAFLESFLYWFDIQARYEECVELTGRAMAALRAAGAAAGTEIQRRALGRVLALHAAFRFRLGDFALARQHAVEALALLEPLRPQRDVGHARLYLAAARYGLGELAQAVAGFLAAAEAYREAGHDWGIGAALDNAGYLEHLRGNRDAARRHLTAGLAIARQTGSRYLLTGLYDHLATLSAAEGDFAAALDYMAQCRQVLEELDRPYIVASLSVSLGQIALQAGDPAAAEEHIGRAVRIARDTGNRLDLASFLLQLGAAAKARGNGAAAAAARAEAATIAQAIGAEGLLAEAQLAAGAASP